MFVDFYILGRGAFPSLCPLCTRDPDGGGKEVSGAVLAGCPEKRIIVGL